MADEWKAIQKEKRALISTLVNQPRRTDHAKLLERLKRVEIIEIDMQDQRHRRAAIGGTLAIGVK